MKLILIYGSPGTGKLTIATELAKQTGYTLFHNHMMLNALSDIFGFEHPIRRKLEKEFRLRVVEEAVKTEINLIVTGVITKDNEAFYRKMLQTVVENEGECILVRLTAAKNVLLERVSNRSRIDLKKISTVERFTEWEHQYPESFEKIEYSNQLTVDTTKHSPSEVTAEIMSYFNLV